MTPEAMKAAKKMIVEAATDIKVIPEWVGQLDGYDVFAIHYDIPVEDTDETLPLLGWPEYVFVDPKHPNEFVCKSDALLKITNRLEEAAAKAKAKAKH